MKQERNVEVRARLEAVLDLAAENLLSAPLDPVAAKVMEEALTALGGRLPQAPKDVH
jgi:hypothetical protein